MAQKTSIKIKKVSDLNSQFIQNMFQLYEQYYEDTGLDIFKKDISEKSHVILLYQREKLIGFSTKLVTKDAGVKYLFSGDTVVDKNFWGSKALQKGFYRFIIKERLKDPFKKMRWMLISKGFKTYKMMVNNFAKSYPSPFYETPSSSKQMMDHYYLSKFGSNYSSDSGLIQFKDISTHVKGDMATPSQHDLNQRSIQHFLRLNPNYNKGVELACMAEVRFVDFVHLSLKVLSYLFNKGKSVNVVKRMDT